MLWYATGLCRSGWQGWMSHDSDIELPYEPGHELAGTIVELGSNIKNFKIGDRVTVPFVGGCGHCEQFDSGNHQVCNNQFQTGFTAGAASRNMWRLNTQISIW